MSAAVVEAAVAAAALGADADISIQARPPDAGGGGGGGGGHEETSGNNLSFPVIWSDGAKLTLRGTFGAPVFDGTYTAIDGVNWYHQQDPLNAWQAQSADWGGVDSADVNVDWVDWGDNLEARDWPAKQPVRVETVLYQDMDTLLGSTLDGRAAALGSMSAFTMRYLSGEGPSEMQGTNTVTYDSGQATVYSGSARLTIQQLSKTRDDPTLTLAWNAQDQLWEGDVGATVFSDSLVTAAEGPGGYSAEVNVAGKAIYGYNWRPLAAGDYRLTFSFDAVPSLNTFFDEDTGVVIPVEEAGVTPAAEPIGGGTAVVDHANDLTYIDVRITAKGKGGGRGGGGGPPARTTVNAQATVQTSATVRTTPSLASAAKDLLAAEEDAVEALVG